MKIEKFSKDGKPGVRFKNAVFAASKNHNGAHFDPLEVFKVDLAPELFNADHNPAETVEAQFESTITPNIEGKLLKFSADIVSYDPNVVDNADKVSGFSPELSVVNQPAKRGNERFYATGDLTWTGTAVLFGEKPGFVGADEFTLEKFSVSDDSDVVIDESKVNTDIVDPEPIAQDAKPVDDSVTEPKTEEFSTDVASQILTELKKLNENFNKSEDENKEETVAPTSEPEEIEGEDEEQTPKEEKQAEQFAKLVNNQAQMSKGADTVLSSQVAEQYAADAKEAKAVIMPEALKSIV